jgi:hypothetical protein
MKRKRIKVTYAAMSLLAAFTGVPSGAGSPTYRHLSANEITLTVVGRGISDDAHWSDYFLAGGVLTSYDLGNLKQGTWKLEGDDLCLIHRGKHPTNDCYEIWVAGTAVQYRRDGVVIAEGFLRPVPDTLPKR